MLSVLLLGLTFTASASAQDVWLQNYFGPASIPRDTGTVSYSLLVNNNSGSVMPSNTILVKAEAVQENPDADVDITICGNKTVNEGSCLLNSNLFPGASWNFGPVTLEAPGSIFPTSVAVKFSVSRAGDMNHLNDSISINVPFDKSATDLATSLDPSTRTVNVGDTIAYTLTTTAQGEDTAGATATVEAPDGVTLDNFSDTDCEVESGGNGFTCDLGVTPARAITFDATFTEVDPAVTLTSDIGSDSNQDPQPANDQDASVVTVEQLPVDLVATSGSDQGVAAGKVRYEIGVRNDGPNDVTSAGLEGTLPDGVAFSSATVDLSNGTCTSASGNVTCDLGAIASGQSATVRIIALVDADRAGQTLSATFDAFSELRETNSSDNSTMVSFLALPAIDATILTGPPATSTENTAAFTYSSNARQPAYECKLDGQGFTPCPAAGIEYADLADGQHSFSVRATDVAGNVGTVATHSWTVQTAAVCSAVKLGFSMKTFKPKPRGVNPQVPGLRIQVTSGRNVEADIKPRYRYRIGGKTKSAKLKARTVRINGKRRMLFGIPPRMAHQLRHANGRVTRNMVTFELGAVLRLQGASHDCDQNAGKKRLRTRITGVNAKRALALSPR